ncbi:MAG TPA: Rieske (2Fe-2S) protein [Streptosporangiaceae bacterium]|nr:Rieske (2Fe-2S) protein [Streptosporangiaceae bacterium]
MRGIARYVDDLLRSRRPRRFRASEPDASVAQTAIMLRAARPGSGAPREEFVTGLHRRLASELDPPAPGRTVSRRKLVLRTAGVAAGTAVAGAAIDHGLTGLIAAPAADSTLTPQPGTWLTVAASADLPDGTVRPFSAGAISGFLERVNGRARAVSGICTHQGCKLALAGQPARLVCPCHGAAFALDGAVLTHRLPGSLSPLPRLAVRETGGTVQVYAPAATQSSPGQP